MRTRRGVRRAGPPRTRPRAEEARPFHAMAPSPTRTKRLPEGSARFLLPPACRRLGCGGLAPEAASTAGPTQAAHRPPWPVPGASTECDSQVLTGSPQPVSGACHRA